MHRRMVISDTTAITHLAKIDALHILQQLYFEILIPEAVYKELCGAPRTQPGALSLLNEPWIKVVKLKDRKISSKLSRRLDIGESEAIALAMETSADLLIIDEVAGRAVAKRLVRKIIGMIGVLLEAKKAGVIRSIEPYLIRLKTTGFRMSDELYNFAMTQAGEPVVKAASEK